MKPGVRSTADAITTTLMAAAAVSVLWVNVRSSPPPAARGGPEVPESPVSLSGAATTGSLSAPAGLIVYSDFECPYCGTFARDVWPDIERRFVAPGKLLVAFRHYPIDRIHKFAGKAAEAAECAGAQGRFWPMHDSLFSKPDDLETASLLARARKLGLESAPFENCLSGGTARRKVDSDLAGARELGVSSTPHFFVGRLASGSVHVTKAISGVKGMSEFERVFAPLMK